MTKGERIFTRIQTSDLCNLYGCTPATLRRWIKRNKLDPGDLLDIIDKYLNKWKLDRRKKPESI